MFVCGSRAGEIDCLDVFVYVLFAHLLVNNHGLLLILLSNTLAEAEPCPSTQPGTHRSAAPVTALAGSVCIISVKNLINAVRLLRRGCC